jgi:hypothetical protein
MIKTSTPIVVPPKAQQTFDIWYLQRVNYAATPKSAENPNAKTTFIANYALAEVDASGNVTFYADAQGRQNIKEVHIADVAASMATNADLKAAIEAMADAAGAIGKLQKVIS